MKGKMLSKTLAVAVILLFIGLAMQPSVAVQQETKIDIEPKDYLFQTIIDIANNPEIKNLLEKYKPDLFKVDIDKGIYRKLFLRNPRLIFNSLFTKPSMTVEYLNKCYNNGIEITSILGEDKILETIERFEFIDTKLLDELNNFITNDEELSNEIEKLKEMNKELNPASPLRQYPGACIILLILLGFMAIIVMVFGFFFIRLFEIFPVFYTILFPIIYIFDLFLESIFVLSIKLDCIPWPPWEY